MLKDSGLGTMLKNLLKTGLTEPCPSRMPKKDDYGYYLDVKLKGEQAKKISFLINNTAGKNLTGDKSVEKLAPR